MEPKKSPYKDAFQALMNSGNKRKKGGGNDSGVIDLSKEDKSPGLPCSPFLISDATGSLSNPGSISVFQKLAPQPSEAFESTKKKKKEVPRSLETLNFVLFFHPDQLSWSWKWSSPSSSSKSSLEQKLEICETSQNSAEPDKFPSKAESLVESSKEPEIDLEAVFLQKKRNLKIKTAYASLPFGDMFEDMPKLKPVLPPKLSLSFSLDEISSEEAPKMNFSIADPVKPLSYTVNLFSNLPSSASPKIDFTDPSLEINNLKSTQNHSFQLPPSVLKSLLQKNVRMCRPWPAVRTALALIRLDFVQFIRRFSIIIIEDAILHPDLPFVIWLMGASAAPNFILTEFHVNRLLGMVLEVASVMWKDPYLPDSGTKELFPGLEGTLPEPEATLLRCLWTRSSFGGMKGDIEMLKTFCGLWFLRFSSKEIPKNFPKEKSFPAKNSSLSPWYLFITDIYACHAQTIDFRQVGQLMPHDVILSAIDFHCSSLMETCLMDFQFKSTLTTFVREKLGEEVDPVGKLSSMIWWFRSCTNLRHSVVPGLPDSAQNEKDMLLPLWFQLKTAIDAYSSSYVSSRWKKGMFPWNPQAISAKSAVKKSSSNFCE